MVPTSESCATYVSARNLNLILVQLTLVGITMLLYVKFIILQTGFEFCCDWVSSEHDLKWLYLLGSFCNAWYGFI